MVRRSDHSDALGLAEVGGARPHEAAGPHERQVEVGQHPGGGVAHVGDGVEGVHGGPDPAPVALVAVGVLVHRLEVHLDRRVAVDDEAVLDRAVAPVGVEVVVHLPERAEHDERLLVDPRRPHEAHAADGAGGDGARAHVQVGLRLGHVEVHGEAVDGAAEALDDHRHRLLEDGLHGVDERATGSRRRRRDRGRSRGRPA